MGERGRQKQHEPLMIELGRDLTEEDLKRIEFTPRTAPPPIQKVRAIHQRQAQLIAKGATNEEIAILTDTSPQRISEFQKDPLFRRLIDFYATQERDVLLDAKARINSKMVNILEQSLDEINERLEDPGARAGMTMRTLTKVAEMVADRTIAPPKGSIKGTGLPPAKIQLNFGFQPKQNPTTTIEIEPDDPIPLQDEMDEDE